jgi:hypothetical protein
MAGDTNITGKPLLPQPEVYFTPTFNAPAKSESPDSPLDFRAQPAEESNMAGNTNITGKSLLPEPAVYFTPAPNQQFNDPPAKNEKEYRWVKCTGCGGEVGIPSDRTDGTVKCPQCKATVAIYDEGLIYRPPALAPAQVQTAPLTRDEYNGLVKAASQSSAPASPPPSAPRLTVSTPQQSASLELSRAADKAMIWGILSIILGWTIIVPIICLCIYAATCEQARKEHTPTPTRATVGLILALLFGIVQGLTMIAHLAK